jgi:phospholipase/lecithinase/hemolysin
VTAGALRFNPENTLFFFAGGLNDRGVEPATTVKNLTEEITDIRQLGGKHFVVALLPEKIPFFAAQGARLNPALRKMVEDLAKDPALDVKLVGWGPAFDDVMEHAASYGFTNWTDACAGRAIYEEDAKPRGDPAKYYYYHRLHPSTAVHRIVGDKLYAELSAQRP